MDNETKLLQMRHELKLNHNRLDEQLTMLLQQTVLDQMQIVRIKKEKLKYKDQITQIDRILLPDIIA